MTTVAAPLGYFLSIRQELTIRIQPEDAAPALRRAACHQHPSEPAESWTTDERTTAAIEARRRAVAICVTECASRKACQDFALRTHPRGIWGGMDERDRREVR